MIIYIFGGIYFDIDVRPKSAFRFWGFGNRTVVTGRGCNNRRHPTGCAHQWGLIYVPFHEVIQNAIEETLGNLAKKMQHMSMVYLSGHSIMPGRRVLSTHPICRGGANIWVTG